MSDKPFRKVLWVNDGNPTWPGHDTYELTLADIGHSDRVECYTSEALQSQIDRLRDAVKILAEELDDKAMDQINPKVYANHVAAKALKAAAAAVRGEVKE
jgi:hypothetical protein